MTKSINNIAVQVIDRSGVRNDLGRREFLKHSLFSTIFLSSAGIAFRPNRAEAFPWAAASVALQIASLGIAIWQAIEKGDDDKIPMGEGASDSTTNFNLYLECTACGACTPEMPHKPTWDEESGEMVYEVLRDVCPVVEIENGGE